MPLTYIQNAVLGQDVLYTSVTTVTWLTWDTMTHWDREVEVIWQRPRSWIKCWYFIVRYLPIFHIAATTSFTRGLKYSESGCKGWVYYELIFVQVQAFAVEAVLVLRVYILYDRSRTILVLILCALTTELTVMGTTLGLVLPKIEFGPTCLLTWTPGLYMAFWMSTLVYETFLFGLTLIKFRQSVVKALGKQSIMYIFIRDGTWAFAMIFVALLVNMLLYKLVHSPLAGMGYGWSLGFMSFAASHILLNLRSIGLQGSSGDSETAPTFGIAGPSALRFAASTTQTDWRTHYTLEGDDERPSETIELGKIHNDSHDTEGASIP